MKRTVILTAIGLLAPICAFSQTKVDTLYYDKDGKGIGPENKIFAAYYRITAEPSDTTYPNKCWDYYSTGELRAESKFISINSEDDSRSILNGEYISYYRSGQTMEKCCRTDGFLNGEYYKYDENGLILQHGFYKDGKRDGIYTEFKEDGNLCVQLELKNGKPLHDYYEVTNSEGFYSKLSIIDDTPVYDLPTEEDRMTEFRDGIHWAFFDMNGITIAVSCATVRDYGKYMQVSVVLGNFSMKPIEFSTEDVTAFIYTPEHAYFPMTVLSADEYMKKVKRQQNWAMALFAFSEGLSASNAAYTTTTTTTYHNGYAYTSVSTSYNATAAYQANVLASNQIDAYSGNLLADREIIDQGYLKKNTIYPGESISGYINIKWEKGDKAKVNFMIDGILYPFLFNCSTKKGNNTPIS